MTSLSLFLITMACESCGWAKTWSANHMCGLIRSFRFFNLFIWHATLRLSLNYKCTKEYIKLLFASFCVFMVVKITSSIGPTPCFAHLIRSFQGFFNSLLFSLFFRIWHTNRYHCQHAPKSMPSIKTSTSSG